MNNRDNNILDDSRIGRLLVKLALPAFFGMFVMTLYNVVDTVFIGHYVGHLGIAGISIVFPVQMLAMGIGHMMGMGGASLISRLIGAGDIARAERALGNAVSSTVILSIVIMVAGLTRTDFWLRLIGSSETILPYARDYMVIILYGMFFQTFAMAMNFLIRAEGNARIPMTGMIIGAVLNIILDAVLIIPLGMGIKGAALATAIAQFITVVYFIGYYVNGKSFLRLHFKALAIEWNILKSIMSIGVAAFAMTVAGSLSAVLANRMLVAYGGDFAVSAFGIIHRIMMFALMPGLVIGQGLQPIIGFNYGARRYDRVLRSILIATVAATALSLAAFFILYFYPEPFIRIFTADMELINLSSYAAKRVFSMLYVIGSLMVGSIIFQATGKALKSFITAIARPVMFLIPLIFILPQYLQLEGIWLAYPITDGLTFVLTLLLVVPEIKRFKAMDLETKRVHAEAGLA